MKMALQTRYSSPVVTAIRAATNEPIANAVLVKLSGVSVVCFAAPLNPKQVGSLHSQLPAAETLAVGFVPVVQPAHARPLQN